jgi:hypothetical protein
LVLPVSDLRRGPKYFLIRTDPPMKIWALELSSLPPTIAKETIC